MCLFLIGGLFASSCHDKETYAEMRKKEKNAINQFLTDNEITGPINVITYDEFIAHDTTTDLSRNEYVLFQEDGIYMQIVRPGNGKTFPEMARERKDTTVSKVVLCRFMEYDIEAGDTTYTNYTTPSVTDKMVCSYSLQSKAYTARFTEGIMVKFYSSNVPAGWLKPLDYVRLDRQTSDCAKVRLIVPHASGTTNASNYVLPCYYEITYMLGL